MHDAGRRGAYAFLGHVPCNDRSEQWVSGLCHRRPVWSVARSGGVRQPHIADGGRHSQEKWVCWKRGRGELAMAASAQRPWRDGAGGGCRGRGSRALEAALVLGRAECVMSAAASFLDMARVREACEKHKANRNVIALTRNELALPAVLSTRPACARSPAPPRRPPRASNCPTSVAKDKSCLREEPPQPSLVPWERCPETRPPSRLAGCATLRTPSVAAVFASGGASLRLFLSATPLADRSSHPCSR